MVVYTIAAAAEASVAPGVGADAPGVCYRSCSMTKKLASPALVLRWVATWFVLGLGAGVALLAGDTGHIPSWLLPPVVAIAGAAGGLLASVLFLLAERWALGSRSTRSWQWWSAAAAAGALSMALLAAPLGIREPFALIAGAVGGLVSGWACGRGRRTRRG